jgi:three-Cys-motif partner protein
MTPWHHGKGIRGVIFLDPYGMEVEWATVRAIAQTKALDVWYLFPLMGIYRQAANDWVAIDDSKRPLITRVLGTDDWENAWYDTPHGQKDMFDHPETPVRMVDVDTIDGYVKSRLEQGLQRGGTRTFSHPYQDRVSTRIAFTAINVP